MTGRRSHGRLSALNGVVHQGTTDALINFFKANWPPAPFSLETVGFGHILRPRIFLDT